MRADDHRPLTRSEYAEFRVPASLADRFLCFWTQTIVGPEGVYEHRVLPDACIDIVLVHGRPPMVIGPWDVPFVAQLAVGTSITGARLHPGRASCLLGMPASELLNQVIPTADVNGALRSLRLEGVMEHRHAAARRSALALALSTPVGDYSPVDQGVVAGMKWYSRHPHGRVEQLSRWIGISERQLQRRFSAAVGYGPKTFQCVLRLQRLLKIARETGPEQSLADLAVNTGYADQAHMTRDVQRLANLRPTELLGSAESTLQMSDLFKT